MNFTSLHIILQKEALSKRMNMYVTWLIREYDGLAHIVFLGKYLTEVWVFWEKYLIKVFGVKYKSFKYFLCVNLL